MIDKYIKVLYAHCLVARKEVAMQDMQIKGFTEKEHKMVGLERVGDILFQVLLLDDVKFKDGELYVEFLHLFFSHVKYVNSLFVEVM